MKTVAICQARMGSTRLPGKVLKDLSGRPVLDWVVEAAKQSPGVDQVVVATSTLPQDDPIVEWALAKGVAVFRGSETDVLSRFLGAAHQHNADIIVRLTGDCPFLDPRVIGEVIKLREMKNADYATNTDPPSYPDGLDVEVFTRAILEASNKEAIRRTDRDTVTRFMVRNRYRFSAVNLVCPLPDLVRERWVLDSPEDYAFIQAVSDLLPVSYYSPSYLDILGVLSANPALRDLNSHLSRNERFYEDLKRETTTRSYKVSAQCLKQAEHLIPLGAQTFSKSKLMFPEGVAPLFVTHGDGGYVFDVDGHDYVDLVGGLLPNVLGYRDPDVDQAIRDQLSRGISFSLATPLEEELAEKLNYHIPSAEMVRFGKNGSDVTTAGIRLARHITGRDRVYVGGYHGWHDWSMSVSEHTNGIPGYVQNLSRPIPDAFMFDSESVKPAAIILEPEFKSRQELELLRRQCDHAGIILIFDEIITGFRCGMGGLQREYGVTPDLSTFGKAMANGMPISALVGLEKYMKRMPEISYSGTFFGETLSIAAAIATIDKLTALQVHDKLFTVGEVLRGQINTLIKQYSVEGIELYSRPELNRIKFRDKHLQSIFIQEMAKNGVLIIGSHNTCYAHNKPELDRVIYAWDSTLKAISAGVKLEGEVIKGKTVR
jgi:glutamate-1-semialdehyde 2,1-aminomutase